MVKPYRIVSRESREGNTVVKVRGIPIGGEAIQVIAGPCSVETPNKWTPPPRRCAPLAAG